MSNNRKRVGGHNSQVIDLKSYANQKRVGLVSELWGFLKHNKKWWLLPLLTILIAFGALIVLSGTTAGPFIYSLF
jgi:Family of unknown function (DUF5989)